MSNRLNYCDTLRPGDSSTDRGRKRKRGALLETRGERWIAYPSPPMSVPPSPAPSSAVDIPVVTTTGPDSADPIAGKVAPTSHPSTPYLPATGQQSGSHPSIFGYLPTSNAATGSAVSSSGQHGAAAVSGAIQAIFTTPQSATSSHPGIGASASAGPPPTRGGRRSKTHVASACINCKRAHLSCDVQRPCTRCIAAGKQDTCIDVQHKKRGRPRLREEAEYKVEQMTAHRSAPASVQVGPTHQSVRSIATTRPRRGDSFRSLQSFTSDDSTSYASSASGYGIALQSPFTTQYPPTPGSVRSTFEVATAFLNMDLVVVKANRPFDNIMLRGGSTQGLYISDIAAPADDEGFTAVRNRLRAEREARDPAYMPPIQLPGQDPLQSIQESEVDQFVDGFSDVTYTWSQVQLGPANETFPARVRLAKASTYFVVVTLPSFQPVEQQLPAVRGPLTAGPPLPTAERFLVPREPASQSASPYVFQHARPPGMTFYPPTPSGLFAIGHSSAYTPSHPQVPQQQQPQSYFAPRQATPPRLPIAEPPTETTAFTPRSVPRTSMQPPSTGALHLPPIVSNPAVAPPASQRVAESSTQHLSSSDDEGEGRQPRKRRMGIDDVLQR